MRRNITQKLLAARIGASRWVVSDIEHGKPSTSIAAYLAALWALDLLDDMKDVALPERDRVGTAFERMSAPTKAYPKKGNLGDF